MHEKFFGYYAPTQAEYERLWKEALIVIDTNVLLSLYRLPKTARDEFVSVLEGLKDRLWVPYQVALEFQRSRLTVIANERRNTEAALEACGELVEQVTNKVGALQIDKHGLGFESEPLLNDLDGANSKLIEAIKAVHAAQLEITATDPIREQIDGLLGDNVGDPPKSQEQLDALAKDGEARYEAKIPPGFADSDKEKNPNNAAFVHDGLTYPRKFGDLILWRQLIAHCKAKKQKAVLFVTSDKKDDWWWREQGKTVGPHPELTREIRRESSTELFWMYSSVQFLEHAKTYTKTKISDTSLAELQDVVRQNALYKLVDRGDSNYVRRNALLDYVNLTPRSIERFDMRPIEASVLRWLENTFGEVVCSKGFPDFLISSPDGLHGFEVKFVRHFEKFAFPPALVNSMLRGYVEVNESRLTSLTLVVVIEEEAYARIRETDQIGEVKERMRNLLAKYPIAAILVGTVHDDGEFEPLVHTPNLPNG